MLAKHIQKILPSNSTILHQDDFAPVSTLSNPNDLDTSMLNMLTLIKPIEQVPYATEYPDIQDWDDPPTCILWNEFRSTMDHLRNHGTLPHQHTSHDHLNKQVEVEIDPSVQEEWKQAFKRLKEEKEEENIELVWYIVDGFVLYWDMVSHAFIIHVHS